MSSVEEQLEDEWYMVRHSGEIPEIALNASFYYLLQDKRGPRLSLTEEQTLQLKHAARDRFQEIVLRDLIPENRSETIYRGTARAIANWHRYEDFCQRQGLQSGTFKNTVANQFRSFIEAEQKIMSDGAVLSGINSTLEELQQFARSLGIKDKSVFEQLALLLP